MPSTQTELRPEKKVPDLSIFTVMISRGMGKVRSFSISSRFLILASVIFALYIVVSVVVISLYFGELRTQTVQSDLVQQLAHETEETRQALYQARQRLRFLEDYICKSEGKEKKEAGIPVPETVNSVPEGPVPQADTLETPAEEESREPLVTIEQLTTKRSGGRLSVKFRLIKTDPDRKELSGYIFIIAANSKSDPPQLLTHPKVALRNGVPIDCKRGQPFKVRNYRIIRGKFFLDSDSETPSLLTILGYDTSGKSILKKVFAIEEAP